MANEKKGIPQADRLTGQLTHLPAIIGRLGLSIAEAQKELNADYVASLGRILQLAHVDLAKGARPAAAKLVIELARSLAPSRYQFTETTLEFSADLSESKSSGGSGTISAGMGAVMLSAGYSTAFGYDYRAAARITTVLHSHPLDKGVADKLFTESRKLKDLKLPDRTDADEQVAANLKAFMDAVSEIDEAPAEGPAGGGNG